MKTKLIDLLGLTNMANDIRDWVNAKFQRKVDGKGLSTNDYDGTAKAKVDAIPADPKYTDTVYDDTALSGRVSTIEGKESGWDAKQDALVSGTNIKTVNGESLLGSGNIEIQGGGGGEENVIETVKVNGVALTPDSEKAVDVEVPTKTSDLQNDSGFITGFTETDPTVPSWAKQQNKPSYNYSEIGNTPDLSGFITKSVNDLTNYYLKSETYTQAEVEALIGAIQQFHYEIYATLPASGESNVLYLIGPTGSGSDRYEEYVWNSTRPAHFVKIGDTSINLSDYVTTKELSGVLKDYATINYVNNEFGNYTPTSNLATVATSGSYNDLDDKPTIPTVPVQDVTVGGTSVVSNGTAVIPQEVFWVEYGVTTSSELDAQLALGKILACKYDDRVHIFTRKIPAASSYNYYWFAAVANDMEYYVRLRDDNQTWYAQNNQFQFTSHRVTSWQTTPDNSHYPSEKLVKDYVDGICGDIQTILISI